METEKYNKAIVILGPTATGKTKLGVELAREFNGEIINADSRQVYKGMDIGTGKDLDEYRVETKDSQGNKKTVNIPHHLIDVVHPNTSFNLAKYQKTAYKRIEEILSRNRIPIIVGGTGLYIQALVEGFNLSGIAPDKRKRRDLENKDVSDLYGILQEINPDFASRVNESDRKNPVRLIRYIEICRTNKESMSKKGSPYDFLLLGIALEKEELEERIYKRLVERLEKEGMIEEVERLHKREKVSWKRLDRFGLEYRYVSKYLQGKLEYQEMVDKLYIAIRRFSKKQMTWFRGWEKKGADIRWIKSASHARRLVKNFVKK